VTDRQSLLWNGLLDQLPQGLVLLYPTVLVVLKRTRLKLPLSDPAGLADGVSRWDVRPPQRMGNHAHTLARLTGVAPDLPDSVVLTRHQTDNGCMNRPVLTTSRIRLEPMTSEHLPLLVELDADAEVLRYILGRARSVQEAHDHWAPICADVDADAVGLGWWVGWKTGDDAFLGWWDLSPTRPVSAAPTTAEAGWRLARRHWRQGYATEGARAVLEHGFATVGLDEISAATMAVNEASRRVMSRLGMRHLRTEHRSWDYPLVGADQGEVVYGITRESWLTKTAPAPSGSS
jgi:RimJ/RimL family protein N-acetyltransferase